MQGTVDFGILFPKGEADVELELVGYSDLDWCVGISNEISNFLHSPILVHASTFNFFGHTNVTSLSCIITPHSPHFPFSLFLIWHWLNNFRHLDCDHSSCVTYTNFIVCVYSNSILFFFKFFVTCFFCCFYILCLSPSQH